MKVIEVLKEGGNQRAIQLWQRQEDLKKMLYKRNHSILAHGQEPLDETKFENFRNFILEFWQPANTLKFPALRL